METIKATDCEIGKWYHDSTKLLLCIGPLADGWKQFVDKEYKLQANKDFAMEPLPNCTGWDWVEPPKYRPFKDAWEFVESAKGRRIACQAGSMQITAVDFSEHPICVKLCGGWYSLKALCEQFIFEDTGSPCGVEL
jgi:hypothetical protein